ncbi:carotenoid biosynthesis protein [Nevskia soli]|uniref:carotenoid biosynthesis protein n=1 Tax=Nevskia soli TaxID=418856 RepID=UPI0015D8AB6D
MGYLSWTLAVVIAGGRRSAIPFVASFVMVSWDLSMEPVWATVVHAWKWLDGGPYFGVPLSNFTGWFLTVWLIYQLFALFLGRGSSTINAQPIGYWREAIAFYAVSAAPRGTDGSLRRDRRPMASGEHHSGHSTGFYLHHGRFRLVRMAQDGRNREISSVNHAPSIHEISLPTRSSLDGARFARSRKCANAS